MQNAKCKMQNARWLGAAMLALMAQVSQGQQRLPSTRIGYVYPAGAQRGTTVEVTVGGQLVAGAKAARVSGQGVHTEFIGYDRPLTQREVLILRDKIQEAQKIGDSYPSASILDRADKQCDILLLGQSSTTEVGGAGKDSGRAY